MQLPPLFSAMAAAGADPLAVAVAEARKGCDAGLVTWDIAPARLCAAIVFAPEVPLARAAVMLPLCGIGIQNALGALAPPEVAVHLDWDGGVRLNGGRCGGLGMAAATRDPDAQPDWLVIGLTLARTSPDPDGGHTPDRTTLFAEGCSDLAPDQVIEAWVRHSLAWLDTWESDGNRPLHREWSGLAHGRGQVITAAGRTGTFVGLDEDFGLLLRHHNETALLPLTDLLRDMP